MGFFLGIENIVMNKGLMQIIIELVLEWKVKMKAIR